MGSAHPLVSISWPLSSATGQGAMASDRRTASSGRASGAENASKSSALTRPLFTGIAARGLPWNSPPNGADFRRWILEHNGRQGIPTPAAGPRMNDSAVGAARERGAPRRRIAGHAHRPAPDRGPVQIGPQPGKLVAELLQRPGRRPCSCFTGVRGRRLSCCSSIWRLP